MKTILWGSLVCLTMGLNAQTVSTFEARYFTSDARADGKEQSAGCFPDNSHSSGN